MFYGLIITQTILKRFLFAKSTHILKKLVDLDNEAIEGRDVSKETLWDNDATIVLACSCSSANQFTEIVYNICETLVAILALFKDDKIVR